MMVNMFTGLTDVFIFRQSTTVRAGLYTLKLNKVNTYRLLFSSFVRFHVQIKSVASLSRVGISVHTVANLFHNMSLLLFGLKQQSASGRKAAWRKKESTSGI